MKNGRLGWTAKAIAEDIEDEIRIALQNCAVRVDYGCAYGKIRAYYRAGILSEAERDGYLAMLDGKEAIPK